jgi:hypothetical protein
MYTYIIATSPAHVFFPDLIAVTIFRVHIIYQITGRHIADNNKLSSYSINCMKCFGI